jgi:hypothetical protein
MFHISGATLLDFGETCSVARRKFWEFGEMFHISGAAFRGSAEILGFGRNVFRGFAWNILKRW